MAGAVAVMELSHCNQSGAGVARTRCCCCRLVRRLRKSKYVSLFLLINSLCAMINSATQICLLYTPPLSDCLHSRCRGCAVAGLFAGCGILFSPACSRLKNPIVSLLFRRLKFACCAFPPLSDIAVEDVLSLACSPAAEFHSRRLVFALKFRL